MKKTFFQLGMVIPLALLLCVSFGCQQQVTEEVPEGITEEEAQILMDDVLLMWNEGSMDMIDKHFAPEVVVHCSTFPEDLRGLEGVENWVTSARTSFPDFTITFDEIMVKDNKVMARWTLTGTNTGPLSSPAGELPATGKKINISGISLMHMAESKIVEEWVIYNVLEMMQQLGFTLTPPQPPEEKKE
ncbi:MAG: ester cyclase [Candidatus Aminicenantes bacterium]